MSNYIIELQDTCVINGEIDKYGIIQACSSNVSPACCNLGMRACDDDIDEEVELEYEELEASEDNSNQEKVKKKYKKRKLSYYVGFVPLSLVDEDGNSKNIVDKDGNSENIYLRVGTRFKSLDVANMINAICDDDEIQSYLKTGKKDKDKLIVFDNQTRINFNNLFNNLDAIVLKPDKTGKICLGNKKNEENKYLDSLEKVKEEVKKELEAIKNLNKKICSDEICNNEDFLPYSINLAVLFECYARTIIKNEKSKYSKYSEYSMLEYVADKEDLQNQISTNINLGAKNICIPSKRNKDDEFIYLDGVIIPDIVLKDENDKYIVYDVKYKDYQKKDRMDRLQLLAYAYMYDCEVVGHIFPEKKDKGSELLNELGEYEINSKSENQVKYKMFSLRATTE